MKTTITNFNSKNKDLFITKKEHFGRVEQILIFYSKNTNYLVSIARQDGKNSLVLNYKL